MPFDTFGGCNICSLQSCFFWIASWFLDLMPCFWGAAVYCWTVTSQTESARSYWQITEREILEYNNYPHLIYKIGLCLWSKFRRTVFALFYKVLCNFYFLTSSVYTRLEWCCEEWDLTTLLPFMLHPVKYIMLKSTWLLFNSCFHFYKQKKV